MYQVTKLLSSYPNTSKVNLDYLNIRDLTLLLPKLGQFPHMQQLTLQKNYIQYMPNCQNLKELKILDLTNNPLKVDTYLLDSLFSIPRLQCLNIDVNQSQMHLFTQNLPNLKYLNGRIINRQKQQQPTTQIQLKAIIKIIEQQKVKAKTLFNSIYKIMDQQAKIPQSNDDFQFQYKQIIQEFEYFYTNITNPLAKECILIYFKNKMLEVIDTNLISFLQQNGYEGIATVIQMINKNKKDHFQDILKIVLGNAYSQDFSKQTLNVGNKLRKQTLYHNQITRLKQKINDLSQQNKQLARVNEQYIKMTYKYAKQQSSRPKLKNYSQSQILKPRDQNSLIKSHSKRQLHNKTSKSITKPDNSPRIIPKEDGRLMKSKNKSIDKSMSYKVLPTKQKNSYNISVNNYDNQNSKNRMLKLNKSMKNITASNQSQNLLNIKDSKNNIKKITLDQLIQLIEQFMAQKAKFNMKCVSKKQVFQTAQQFLFTFFMRKYGLKQIALDWSMLIIKSLQKFSKQLIVQIFAKILQNEIQQSFYQESLQFSILTSQIVRQLLGNVPDTRHINYSQVQNLFYTLFPDSNVQQYDKWANSCGVSTNNNLENGKYILKDILLQIEQYYFKSHKSQIQMFVNTFRRYDNDEDGILEGIQIDQCINNLASKIDEQQEKQIIISNQLIKKIKGRTELLQLIRGYKLKFQERQQQK